MSKVIRISVIALLFTVWSQAATVVRMDEVICGRWMSEDKDLMINISKQNTEYTATIVWFDDRDETKKMEEHVDGLNPDPSLRNRKLVGINMIEKLEYSPESNTWENGVMYDAQQGRQWNSCAYINQKGELKVKTYWHLKFLGKTRTFKRI